MSVLNKTDIRNLVRKSYGKIAGSKGKDEGCCSGSIKIRDSVYD
jgi:arsenite methyltransferase